MLSSSIAPVTLVFLLQHLHLKHLQLMTIYVWGKQSMQRNLLNSPYHPQTLLSFSRPLSSKLKYSNNCGCTLAINSLQMALTFVPAKNNISPYFHNKGFYVLITNVNTTYKLLLHVLAVGRISLTFHRLEA